MRKFLHICRKEVTRNAQFPVFDEIYLFGSSLYSSNPNDIDILLVYAEGKEIRDIDTEKNRMEKTLSLVFHGMDIHFVTLSHSELKKTKFLTKTECQQIK